MFVRPFTIFSAIALAGVSNAVATNLEVRTNGGTCNEGFIQCCTIYQSTSTEVINIFRWFNLPPPSSGTQIGLTCTPVSIGGTGHGSTCTQQTVCCDNNVFAGVSTGCSPIVINE